MNKINKTEKEWKSLLTEDEYYVTRQKGTEPPFSGKNFEIIQKKSSSFVRNLFLQDGHTKL